MAAIRLAALVPAGLVMYLSFSAGGFFPGATGVAAAVLALVLAIRGATSRNALAPLGPAATVAGGALVLFAGWTLLSASWSDATGRAVIEFDRVLLYLLAVVTFGSLGGGAQTLRWMIRGIAAAVVAVCAVALTTRVAADVWPIGPNVATERLSYPITYWNAVGLLAALGIMTCFHLTSDTRERAVVRVLGAASIPLLAATLLFTYSRAGAAVTAIALVTYAVLGRPRGLLGAIVATAPTAAIACIAAYGADKLATPAFASTGGIDQGHGVALAVAATCLGAALVRAALLPLDARVSRWRPDPQATRRVVIGLTATGAVALVVAAAALDLPGRIGHEFDRFAKGEAVVVENARSRLTNVSNNGRTDYWKASLDAFRDDRLKGSGAGTFQLTWARERPLQFTVVDGHSLYGEVLGELGLVGLVLLVVALLALLVGLARRALAAQPGPGDRPLQAVCFVALLAWAIHAGVDWDWEMPVVGVPVLALALAAVRRPAEAVSGAPRLGWPVRAVVVAAAAALALMPLAAAWSQFRLDDAIAQMKAGRCGRSIDAALASDAALPVRAEPWEVIGYCRSRLKQNAQAVSALRRAVERDPRNWELHYGLALVLGAGGADPRAEAVAALRLNPLEPLAKEAVNVFVGTDPAAWRRAALKAPLPIQ